ncbi:hypothetical protein PIB30_101154 [Stylosanthes scabra]|uniref:RNase H type-1 domain-containing protein n=1 Tax=Stylosanthes scabra TaxID=79078 RepID=A0ABU6SXV6_9FABA|nr:hypothetical protein [Stylosanthes scabra]
MHFQLLRSVIRDVWSLQILVKDAISLSNQPYLVCGIAHSLEIFGVGWDFSRQLLVFRVGLLKMHNGDIVGFGCAIRDNNGDWQRGCAGTIQVSSVLEGELFAIYKGLLLAWEAGFKEVYCETDCHEAYVPLKDSNISFVARKVCLSPGSKIYYSGLGEWS